MADDYLNKQQTGETDMHVIENILNDKNAFSEAAELFKQLSNPSRLKIYWLLCHSEECVMDIADRLNMSSPTVSHHLRVLKSYDLITNTRSGKEVYYKASEIPCSAILHNTIEQVMEIVCPLMTGDK